jgi:microcystin-dependent protein
MASRNRDFFELTARARPMVGDTKTSALDLDHLGWLKCDGRSLATNQFQFLFDVIGYSFGGSGSNFFLPDPRGCVPGFVGSNDGVYTGPTGPTNRLLGQVVGEEAHRLTIDQMPSHGHTGTTSNALTGITASDSGHSHTYQNQPNTVSPAVSATTTDVADNVNVNQTTAVGYANIVITDPGHVHNFTTTNTGGSNYHNNMQPTIFVGSLFIYSGKPHYGLVNGAPFNYTSIPIV